MATRTVDLPVELSLMRIVAQGLVPGTAAVDPIEVVRGMLATQGQMTSNVPHSLISRTASSVGSDVNRAFESCALVRSWPFRGTLHITTAEDYRWLRALKSNIARFNRAAADLELTAAHVEHAREASLGALASGPQTRTGLRDHWLSNGVGSHLEETARARLIYILFVQFHQDGTFVSGPLRGNEHLIVSADHLVHDSTGWGERIDDGDPTARREALTEVARRYAMSHGPVTAADLARWAGLGVRAAQEALTDALADDGSNLTVAHLVGKGLVEGAPSDSKVPAFYLRRDLWELLEENRRAALGTLYLAMFDELHVGYKDRSCLTDAAGEKLVCPGGNGMFRPLVVDRGRMVAVNPKNIGLLWHRAPGVSLERRAERAMAAIAERLSR